MSKTPKEEVEDLLRRGQAQEGMDIDQSEDGVKLYSLSARISTPEEACQKAEIDLTKWEIYHQQVKSWEMGSKVEATDEKGRKISKGVAVTPLFGVTVRCRPRTCWPTDEFLDLLMERVRENVKPPPTPNYISAGQDELCVEVSIFDHHMGKLAWAPETDNNYDLKIAERRYREAVADLLGWINPYRPAIKRFLYPIGNDFLHVDKGGANTTTAGTPQHCDGRWQKAYLRGFEVIKDTVGLLRTIAPVDILVVPGNHDEEKMFCLGHGVDAYFHNDEMVTVDNAPKKRKAYRWGTCLIGFEHGDKQAKRARAHLPQSLATEFPNEWAETTWREIHLGHLHIEREDVHRRSDTFGATIVRTIPSLSGTDTWHFDQGYRAPMACECFLWHHDRGRVGQFTTTPRPVQVGVL